ncbi:MAG: hypothetical protein A2937_01875 [Candidatus Yonathbacteria bacterium RIFCSPLOWO2_01_FULL_47_33b]|uniref:Uncharacterized protein n=1 Tax=Candidatus Yonathbacteria bacterium RIFCSPLOWO2_01_FULL_47_33b TaxID=1802727 RepID=A0A1G2SGK7_9BACT|nr:MAG: hypothetical protein A2937_01875 [Candidatus Yonathbacteria bacterium RIFCSPLOWO2_01_FULL_47_33b]
MNPHIREIFRYSILALAGYILIYKNLWDYLPYFVIATFLFVAAEAFFYGGSTNHEIKCRATNIKIIYSWGILGVLIVVVYFLGGFSNL